MSDLNFLDNEQSLIDEVIDNAAKDAKENPPQDFSFDTENKDFGKESAFDDFDLIEGDIMTDDADILGGGSAPSGTATIDEKFSQNGEIYGGLSDMDKKRNFLYCQLYVLMMGEGMELVCKLIAGEFGEETENKYSMNKTKQNEIARAWSEVLNMEMSVKSPKGALTMLIFANMLPILMLSIKTAYKKRKEKKAAKTQAMQKQYAAPVIEVVEITQQETTQKDAGKKEQPQAQNKPEFEKIDEKGTAEVLKTEIKAETALKKILIKKTGTRGAKKGGRKNPNTGKREQFKTIIRENGKSFYVYSWGEKKLIPKSHRTKEL